MLRSPMALGVLTVVLSLSCGTIDDWWEEIGQHGCGDGRALCKVEEGKHPPCTDLSSDNNNCGACGIVCDPESICCSGTCTHVVFDRFNCGGCGIQCAEGSDCCGQKCVPLNTRDNCGGCFSGCLPTEECVNGGCVAP